jgi:hypothetical protein
VIYLLVFSLPVILVVAYVALSAWHDLRRPGPRALGTIVRKLRVVSSDEIVRYNATEDQEEEVASHLRRQVRWKQICVNWGYLRQMIWNTRLFQQATRFEAMKIDPAKSALQYEPREILALELVDDTTDMRLKLYKWQLNLLMRAIFGLRVEQPILISLLEQYKQLEEDIIGLAGMAEDDCFRQMLIERLGLNWGVVDGGSATPA